MSKQLLEQFPRPNLVQRFQPPQDGAAPSGANGGAANSPEPALNPGG